MSLWLFFAVLCFVLYLLFFFFKQKTAYEMRISDWSSDVCSSDLYFISNGEPKTARETINGLLRAAGAPTVDKTIPFGVAYAVGAVSEAAWSLLRLRGEPPMTRFLAEQLKIGRAHV